MIILFPACYFLFFLTGRSKLFLLCVCAPFTLFLRWFQNWHLLRNWLQFASYRFQPSTSAFICLPFPQTSQIPKANLLIPLKCVRLLFDRCSVYVDIVSTTSSHVLIQCVKCDVHCMCCRSVSEMWRMCCRSVSEMWRMCCLPSLSCHSVLTMIWSPIFRLP